MSLPPTSSRPTYVRKMTEEGLEYFKDRISERLKFIKITIANKSGQIEKFLKNPEVSRFQIKSLLRDIKEQRGLMKENLALFKETFKGRDRGFFD